MGKILVLYDSRTGNTKRMAELVAEGARSVEGMEVRLRWVAEAGRGDVLWCDGLALGTPTNIGLVSWRIKRFFDEELLELWGKIDGKIGCAFSSEGGWGGGGELACQSALTLLMNYGFLVFGVTDYVGEELTLHYGAVVPGGPESREEREGCRRLGRRLAEWVAAFIDGKRALVERIRKDQEGRFVD